VLLKQNAPDDQGRSGQRRYCITEVAGSNQELGAEKETSKANKEKSKAVALNPMAAAPGTQVDAL
jgi:hypothetical protein